MNSHFIYSCSPAHEQIGNHNLHDSMPKEWAATHRRVFLLSRFLEAETQSHCRFLSRKPSEFDLSDEVLEEKLARTAAAHITTLLAGMQMLDM